MNKQFRQTISFILSLLLCASMLVIPSLAADFTPTVSIYEDDIDKGTIELSQLENTATGSRYLLAATCATGYELRYIQIGTDETTRVYSEDGYTLTWEVTSDELEYTAYFGNAVPHLGTPIIQANPGIFTGLPISMCIPWSKGSGLPRGSRTLYMEAYYMKNNMKTILGTAVTGANVDIPVACTISDGENIYINYIPEDVSEFTVAAWFGENGEVNSKTYKIADLGFRQSGIMHLGYLDVPGGGMGYYSTNDNGPIVYDMAAFVDEQTGRCDTYFSTNGGVVMMKEDGSFLTIDGINGTPVAIGGGTETELCVLTASRAGGTSTSSYTQYVIWQYDEEQGTWNPLRDKSYIMQHPYIYEFDNSSFDPISCVIAKDSIWVKDAHWNGTEWSSNDVAFNSFWKDDRSAYAGSADGVYRYETGMWTKVPGTSGTMYVVAGARSGESVNLLIADTYEPEHRATDGSSSFGVRGARKLKIIDGGTTTITSMDTTAWGTWNNLVGMAINSNDDVFGFQRGRSYNGNDFGGYIGCFVYKLTDGEWIHQTIPEFNDAADQVNIDAGNYPCDQNGIRKSRPDGVRYSLTPTEGMTYFLGLNGAIYADYGTTTISFDSKGGSAVTPITQHIGTAVPAPTSPTLEGKAFSGWFYDEAFTMEWDAYDALMPAKDITLYAKWIDGDDPEAQLAWYKQKAVTALEKQFDKYSPADYSEENWNSLLSAYESGKASINEATAGTSHIEDNVTAALNAALAAMQAVPAKNSREITIAISMDANTLGLGYIIEPTLVTVNKGTPVSVVIADLLSQRAEEKYGITTAGRTDKPSSIESFSTLYPWSSSGTPTGGFYLAQVYFPEQENYHIPDAIWSHIDPQYFIADDANGKYLGEFDYLNTSGWTYSVGDKTEGNAEFPGVGSSAWSLSDDEVVRWQFTLLGYGADLGADNTAWGTSNVVTVGDKSCLTWKVAELRSQYSDETLKAENVYINALAVLTDAEANQADIDVALEALNGMSTSIPQVLPEEKIEITGENSGTPIATVTSEIENGTAILHVTAANPCVVVVEKADGTYERLTAVQNADGSYDFSQEGYTEGMKFHVLLKGDADGNGQVTTDDAMLLARSCLSETHAAYQAASALNQAVYGVINTDLAMQIARACLSSDHAAYQPVTW